MDIAAAYPTETGLISYKRNAALVKGQEIVIKDTFLFHDGSMKENHNTADNINSVIMSLMTYENLSLTKMPPVVLISQDRMKFLHSESVPPAPCASKAADFHG